MKRVHEPGHFHELTFSCYRRKPLLTNDPWRCELSRLIDAACIEAEFALNAFVLMPEHIHLLIFPQLPEPNIGRFLARIKQPFSKHVKGILIRSNSMLLSDLTVRERPGKACFRFWQEGGGYDRNLFESATIERSINYIHLNPVQRGLCKRAIDWKWSSAPVYLAGTTDFDLPTITAPPSELFDVGGIQFANY